MSLLIGKQLQEGVISYIQVDYSPQLPYMVNMLRNFYPEEKHVDQLLALGDLEEMGATPRGQWRGSDDGIRCRAKIRDNKERSRRFNARIAEDTEEFLKLGYTLHYLFDKGEWYVITKHKKENIKTATGAIFDAPKTTEYLKSLTVKENRESANNYSHERLEFSSWDEMKRKAVENNTAYFVYSGDRLLTTINPICLHQIKEQV